MTRLQADRRQFEGGGRESECFLYVASGVGRSDVDFYARTTS